ncbi:MAG TPA: IclR family transcriptional regulator [Jatrophihabitans sp.]|nr:IclR family transcriptional regulator [Jatrophihabitans sp.]
MPETSKTVSQALRLLLALADGGASVAVLSRRLGLSRTVTQRLLATLREHGFVHRTVDGDYQLGMALVHLASRVDNPVRHAAQQPMLQLFEQVSETVALTVREGDDAVSADQLVVPGRLVRAEYPPGFRHPLDRAAAGRAILAFAEPATVSRFVAAAANGPALADSLAGVRRAGFAFTVNELSQGAAGLAAPIRDGSGYAVASVGIVAPADRFPSPERVAGLVTATAEQIRRTLTAG